MKYQKTRAIGKLLLVSLPQAKLSSKEDMVLLKLSGY